MNAMRVSQWQSWLSFSFDDQLKLVDRGIYFGTFAKAAEMLYDASLLKERPLDLAAVMMVAPVIGPSDFREAVCAVASIKLPYNLAKYLNPTEQALWNSREPGS